MLAAGGSPARNGDGLADQTEIVDDVGQDPIESVDGEEAESGMERIDSEVGLQASGGGAAAGVAESVDILAVRWRPVPVWSRVRGNCSVLPQCPENAGVFAGPRAGHVLLPT